MKKLTAILLVVLVTAVFGQNPPDAAKDKPQGEAPKPAWRSLKPPTNLKLLNKDINERELFQVMKGFSLSLGVRCVYCHKGEDGKPFDTFDFASDEKPTKNQARKMFVMVQDINKNQLAKLDLDPAKEHKVSCWTCHRGKQVPDFELPPPPPRPEGEKPPPPAEKK
jgi:hypothetical protein